MKSAWYLQLREEETPKAAILVGDRSRVRTIERHLKHSRVLNEDRGLLTVVGEFEGADVVVVAFGMGAPIAAVVAHELIDLGVTQILRLGTMMRLGDTQLGDFVIADEAQTLDGTSLSYVPDRNLFHSGKELTSAAIDAAKIHGVTPLLGRAMSVDGFYSSMMSINASQQLMVNQRHREFAESGCIGLDMETGVLFALGELFGVDVGSVCLVTVDGQTKEKLEDRSRRDGEELLSLIGLTCLVERASDVSK